MATDALARIEATQQQQAEQRQQRRDDGERRTHLWDAWQDLHGRHLERYRDQTDAENGAWGFGEVPAKYFAWEAEGVLAICKALKAGEWPIGDVQDDGDDTKLLALDIIAAGLRGHIKKLRTLLAKVCIYRTDELLPEIGVSPVPDEDPAREVHWWLRIGIRDELLGLNQAEPLEHSVDVANWEKPKLSIPKPRFKTPKCPRCDGKAKTVSSPGGLRKFKCTDATCGHKWNGTKVSGNN
ncbi:MAG: hypothetical protein IID44_08955 [Planctomycetes bacterium]|nr:hypothetical protein [Planctomycetota bacterium]